VLRVGAPWDASQTAIERLLRRHAAWVIRKLDEWHVRRAPPRQRGLRALRGGQLRHR